MRLLLLRILRKTGALETLEVWGMEKEVGLWEVVAPWRGLGMGNKLGKILLPGKIHLQNNHLTLKFSIVRGIHSYYL